MHDRPIGEWMTMLSIQAEKIIHSYVTDWQEKRSSQMWMEPLQGRHKAFYSNSIVEPRKRVNLHSQRSQDLQPPHPGKVGASSWEKCPVSNPQIISENNFLTAADMLGPLCKNIFATSFFFCNQSFFAKTLLSFSIFLVWLQ